MIIIQRKYSGAFETRYIKSPNSGTGTDIQCLRKLWRSNKLRSLTISLGCTMSELTQPNKD